jgi:hypothetical protein
MKKQMSVFSAFQVPDNLIIVFQRDFGRTSQVNSLVEEYELGYANLRSHLEASMLFDNGIVSRVPLLLTFYGELRTQLFVQFPRGLP